MYEYADWEFSGALDGFSGRGRGRPLRAEGPKMEKVWEPTLWKVQ